jgi:hypothetical protein
MRFPEEGSQDFELVARSGPKRYDVYMLKVQIYPDVVTLLHADVDLERYTSEELDEWVMAWGYAHYADFVDYLEQKTPVGNNELRLCSCIVQNDLFIEPDVVVDGDLEACIDFLTKRIGRNPYDDSETEPEETGMVDVSSCRC